MSGDTLSAIAVRYLGDASRWSEIYDANESAVEAAARSHGYATSDGGNLIFPGTTLTIPGACVPGTEETAPSQPALAENKIEQLCAEVGGHFTEGGNGQTRTCIINTATSEDVGARFNRWLSLCAGGQLGHVDPSCRREQLDLALGPIFSALTKIEVPLPPGFWACLIDNPPNRQNRGLGVAIFGCLFSSISQWFSESISEVWTVKFEN
ncbi:LysM peptidoglycan-binding domain-containing protein [Streptomyces sp. NPDC127063]|uniref:LysM peptidoglycan-binding domain-containing protein n=1 Tax=Streptomyces sp. NPDC127063 TaxID=3347123 RepID=UPI003648E721